MKKYLICAITLGLATLSTAQTIVTDRPSQTDASSTVPKKSLQIESGIQLTSSSALAWSGLVYTVNHRQWLLPNSLFRIGLTDRIEMRVQNQVLLNTLIPNLITDAKSSNLSINDLEVGTKIQLLKNENSKTEIALLSHLGVPTGNTFITKDVFYSVSKLCVSHQISDDFNIGYNLGYSSVDKINNALYSLSFGFSITDKLNVFCESFGLYNLNGFTSPNQKHTSNFDAGLTYLVTDNVQIDWTFGAAINEDMNFISAGCSWLIK